MPEVRLIDANALKPEMEIPNAADMYLVCHIIDNAPTIEPEVRHGRWIPYGRDTAYTKYYRCSLCGYEIAGYAESDDLIKYNYCPNCGADMRKVSKDADDN